MKTSEADKNMKIVQIDKKQHLKWYSPTGEFFRLAGFAFGGKDNDYCRFPIAAMKEIGKTNPAMEMLANNTSGGQLYFRSDSPVLQIKVKLKATASLCHMTAVGECGFDCYIMINGEYKFINAVKYDQNEMEYSFTFFENLPMEQRDILLNFPLYCGVSELSIGLADEAAFELPPNFKLDGRVVVYGTSITQGGCANRSGMSYTNILSRKLGVEFINFGFSGNGKGEPEIIKLIAAVKNARLFVIDYEANASEDNILENTFDGVIDIIRQTYPNIPILVLSEINMPFLVYNPIEKIKFDRRCQFMQENIAFRTQNGDRNLFFIDGKTLLPDYWGECTVDGVHPTDLGFYEMAKSLENPIRSLL